MDEDDNQNNPSMANDDMAGGANPAQLQKYLEGMDYPATKQSVLEKVRQEGADDEVLKTMEKLPDQQFDTPADISEALSKIE